MNGLIDCFFWLRAGFRLIFWVHHFSFLTVNKKENEITDFSQLGGSGTMSKTLAFGILYSTLHPRVAKQVNYQEQLCPEVTQL